MKAVEMKAVGSNRVEKDKMINRLAKISFTGFPRVTTRSRNVTFSSNRGPSADESIIAV